MQCHDKHLLKNSILFLKDNIPKVDQAYFSSETLWFICSSSLGKTKTSWSGQGKMLTPWLVPIILKTQDKMTFWLFEGSLWDASLDTMASGRPTGPHRPLAPGRPLAFPHASRWSLLSWVSGEPSFREKPRTATTRSSRRCTERTRDSEAAWQQSPRQGLRRPGMGAGGAPGVAPSRPQGNRPLHRPTARARSQWTPRTDWEQPARPTPHHLSPWNPSKPILLTSCKGPYKSHSHQNQGRCRRGLRSPAASLNAQPCSLPGGWSDTVLTHFVLSASIPSSIKWE